MMKEYLRKKDKALIPRLPSNRKPLPQRAAFFSQTRQTETLTGEGYHGKIHSLHR
jgi:hypothetical protein